MSRCFVDRRNRYKHSKKRRHSRMDNSSDDDMSEKEDDRVGPDDVCVVQCTPASPMEYWRQCEFFNVYEKGSFLFVLLYCVVMSERHDAGQDSDMYRIKDWPPDATFQEKLTRHYQVRSCLSYYEISQSRRLGVICRTLLKCFHFRNTQILSLAC